MQVPPATHVLTKTPAVANLKYPYHNADTICAATGSMLPAGTCHIAMPGVAAACRILGVDYAPALVGFDVQGGRNLPKILGVVVCQVRSAYR
jgi:hypothetical protein